MAPSNRALPEVRKVGAPIVRPGFSVQKLLFESRPGFWITAILLTPDNLSAQAPGLLFTSGHTQDGFRANVTSEDDYQIAYLNLVVRGFVVLAFDPIGQGWGHRHDIVQNPSSAQHMLISLSSPGERYQYVDGGPQYDRDTLQHEYLGRQLELNGVGAMSFWLWDEQIALDVLAAQPSVDPTRLGVFGCSGGGTQRSVEGTLEIDSILLMSLAVQSLSVANPQLVPGRHGRPHQGRLHGLLHEHL